MYFLSLGLSSVSIILNKEFKHSLENRLLPNCGTETKWICLNAGWVNIWIDVFLLLFIVTSNEKQILILFSLYLLDNRFLKLSLGF